MSRIERAVVAHPYFRLVALRSENSHKMGPVNATRGPGRVRYAR
jgi:hypothetical protein